MSEREYVGIDLHRRRSVIVRVDRDGEHPRHRPDAVRVSAWLHLRAGYVLEPVRPWPDRTMRAQVREEMPGSEAAAPLHEPERTLVREPRLIGEREITATD